MRNTNPHSYAFLVYPVRKTADIVMYSEPGTPLFVPVGEDQVSHVELSREIVRKFNFDMGKIRIDVSIEKAENRELLNRLNSAASASKMAGGLLVLAALRTPPPPDQITFLPN